MRKMVLCLIVVMILVSATATVSSIPSIDAEKASGKFQTEILSSKVCGDILCYKPMSIEEKIQMYLISIGKFSTIGFGGTLKTIAGPTLDFENCGAFLSVNDVKNAINYTDNLEETEFHFPEEPHFFENEDMCAYSFIDSSTQSQILSVVITTSKFTYESANSYYVELDHLESQEYQINGKMTTGDWKQVTVENNVGDEIMILSQKGKHFLGFFTEDDEQFVDISKLRDLSKMIRDKIDRKIV